MLMILRSVSQFVFISLFSLLSTSVFPMFWKANYKEKRTISEVRSYTVRKSFLWTTNSRENTEGSGTTGRTSCFTADSLFVFLFFLSCVLSEKKSELSAQASFFDSLCVYVPLTWFGREHHSESEVVQLRVSFSFSFYPVSLSLVLPFWLCDSVLPCLFCLFLSSLVIRNQYI